MRLRNAAVLIVGAIVVGAAPAVIRAAQGATKTTWDGVYSEAQAGKGETLYGDKCAQCHGPDGSGGDAPDLNGGAFGSNWDTSTVADLFDKTRNTMPQTNPGTLSRDEAAALTAYLLSLNRFPSGPTDLPSESESLRQIKYVAVKPAALLQPASQTTPTRAALLEHATAVFDREMAREKAGDCPNASTTLDMNVCLDKEVTATTANYKDYASTLRSLMVPSSEAFDELEAAWAVYQKALCSAVYRQYQGGTIAPSMESSCALRSTRTHIRELGGILGEAFSH